MIFEGLNTDSSELDTPVIIFGSGPAGISLALDLEKNISSTIFEAGGEFYSDDSQSQYQGVILGDQLESLDQSRLRQLGGTSGIWGGWCRPFEDYDFKKWQLSKKDLDFYLEDACDILEIKNNFRSSLLDDNIKQIEYQYSIIQFGSYYKDHLQKSKNIRVFLNSQLSHFESENKKISLAVIKSKDTTLKLNQKYLS